MVKSACCPSKEPAFSSSTHLGASQPSIALVSGCPLLASLGTAHMWNTHRQAGTYRCCHFGIPHIVCLMLPLNSYLCGWLCALGGSGNHSVMGCGWQCHINPPQLPQSATTTLCTERYVFHTRCQWLPLWESCTLDTAVPASVCRSPGMCCIRKNCCPPPPPPGNTGSSDSGSQKETPRRSDI